MPRRSRLGTQTPHRLRLHPPSPPGLWPPPPLSRALPQSFQLLETRSWPPARVPVPFACDPADAPWPPRTHLSPSLCVLSTSHPIRLTAMRNPGGRPLAPLTRTAAGSPSRTLLRPCPWPPHPSPAPTISFCFQNEDVSHMVLPVRLSKSQADAVWNTGSVC